MDKRWTALTPSRQLVGSNGRPLLSASAPRLIGRLPEEAYLSIFYHLPLADTASLARCARKIAALAKDERVWSRKLALLDWKGSPPKSAVSLLERRASHVRSRSENNKIAAASVFAQSPKNASFPALKQPPFAATPTTPSIPEAEGDGFGDFVDFSGPPHQTTMSHANGNGNEHFEDGFSSNMIENVSSTKLTSLRKDEDLLMLFDDEVEDMGLATASPAKQKQPSPVPAPQPSSVPQSHAITLSHRGTPAPSYDLFVSYYQALLPYFLSLQTQTTSSLVFTRPTASPHHRAELLSNLSRLLSTPVAPTRSSSTLAAVRRNLQSASDHFEAGMLAQFEKAADGNALLDMRETARAVWELNGGSSVVQIFINKIPLFYDTSWDPLKNLTKTEAHSGELIDGIDFSAMDSFMNHILDVVKTEGTTIAKVFPKDSDALVLFAERIAVDVVCAGHIRTQLYSDLGHK